MFCPDLRINEFSHVTTTETCDVACIFYYIKKQSCTTEFILYNSTKLKKNEWAEMDYCLA